MLPWSDGFWFVDRYECLMHDCDFEGQMRTNFRLIKTLIAWHNVKVFVLAPCHRPAVYVTVHDWYVSWEQSSLIMVPSLFIFACYSGQTLYGSEAEKPHISLIEIMKFLVSNLVSLVTAAHNGFSISKTADMRIVADGVKVLVQAHDRLAHWIDALLLLSGLSKDEF